MKSNKIIVRGFITSLSTMDRSSKCRIGKKTVNLNTIDHIDLTDTCRTFHTTIVEYTYFSRVHGTFSRNDQESLGRLKQIKIILSIFSNPSGMKLEISNRKKLENSQNTQKLNNILLNKKQIKEEIKRKIK